MHIKLVALDFDGTLINDDLIITEETKNTIYECHKRGIEVFLNSGRVYSTIVRFARDLKIKLPIACCNGAYMRDEEKIYKQEMLTTDATIKAMEVIRKYGCYFHVFVKEKILAEKHMFWPELYDIWRDGIGKGYEDILRKDLSFQEIVDYTDDDVIKILVVEDDEEKMNSLKNELSEIGSYYLCSSARNILEILKPGISKGVILKEMADKLGIESDEIMAVGDSDNDLSMIEYAGLGVALKNAAKELKSIADLTMEFTNNEEGAAQAIKRFALE
ncbi:MAG: Cof-type HAD-IIB family hydrolase [Eubacteriales bacterium]